MEKAERLRGFGASQKELFNGLVDAGLRSGPVTAYGMVARRQVQAPRLVRIVTLTWLPWSRTEYGMPAFLLASMVFVPVALLLATSAVMAAPMSVQLTVVVGFALVTLLISATLYGIVFGHSRPVLLQHIAAWNKRDKAYWTALVVIVPTVGFATVTTCCVRHNVLLLQGTDAQDASVPFRSFSTYVRSLADAIPFLDVSQTLGWKAGLSFRDWQGNLLLLIYKIALIVPLLQLATLVLKRLFTDEQTAAVANSK
jgi:hypothetical protein